MPKRNLYQRCELGVERTDASYLMCTSLKHDINDWKEGGREGRNEQGDVDAGIKSIIPITQFECTCVPLVLCLWTLHIILNVEGS